MSWKKKNDFYRGFDIRVAELMEMISMMVGIMKYVQMRMDLNYEELTNHKKLYAYIRERLVEDKMTYIFLDEVHNIDNFPRVIDSLYIKKI